MTDSRNGAAFFMYGHDHFFVAAEKFDGGGGTDVHYILAGRGSIGIGGDSERPTWASQVPIISAYDNDGDADLTRSKGNEQVAIFDTGAAYDEINNCWDADGTANLDCGTTEVGVTEVGIFKDESVDIRYMRALPDAGISNAFNNRNMGVNGTFVDHIVYQVDKSVNYEERPDVQMIFAYQQQSSPGTLTDEACGDGVRTDGCVVVGDPDQVSSQDLVGDSDSGEDGDCTFSTDLPDGVYGPSATDPRRSCDYAGDGAHQIADTTVFGYLTTGLSVCAWVKPDTVATGQGNIIAKQDTWELRYLYAGETLRWRLNGSTNHGGETDVEGVPEEEWTHICATWAGNTTQENRIYINGSGVDCAVGACNNQGSVTDSGNHAVSMGAAEDGGNRRFQGSLHEVTVIKNAIEPEQICRIARCGLFDEVEDRGLSCDLPAGQKCSFGTLHPYLASQ